MTIVPQPDSRLRDGQLASIYLPLPPRTDHRRQLGRAALQALEAALAEARQEAEGLASLRDSLAMQAQRDAEARLTPLQAGGSLAAVTVLLPVLQFVYFMLRVLLWLASGLERLGFR